MLELVAADALEWCYRGEGAANIVLAYNGSSPFFMGKVLRLQKVSFVTQDSSNKKISSSEPSKPVLSEEEQIMWANWPSVATATTVQTLTLAYARDVMSPLLGHKHVDPGILVPVSFGFLEIVASNIHDKRPCWRAEASQVDISSNTALLISDHSLFPDLTGIMENVVPSISVEIKPKCGFLPDSAFIAVENSVKKRVSRFAMHQTLKLSQGQIKTVSRYSPLDLFSGNLERINRAIQDLFETPQNNLRVFVDGKVVFGADTEVSDTEALDKTLEDCMSHARGKRVEVLKGLVSEFLYRTDTLDHLLAAQRLDSFDIEGALHAYYKLSGKIDSSCSGSVNRKTCHNTSINIKDESLNHPNRGDEKKICEAFDWLNALTLEDSRKVVQDYLIAATAKDCSIMVTFRQISDDTMVDAVTESYKLIHCPETGQRFCSKMHFLDLDLKPLKKMPYYYKLDQEIVRAYLGGTHLK